MLRWSAARHPERLALVSAGRRVSYGDLDREVNRTANAIVGAGLRRGDRLALLARNSHEFVVLYYACAKAGVIVVPINFMLQAHEVSYILEASGAVAFVVDDALHVVGATALGGELGEQVRVRAMIGAAKPGWLDVDDWARWGDPTEPMVELDDDDPLELLFTSGTESRPKAAALSHRSVIAQHTSCIVGGEMTAADVEVHALPLYHCAQLHCFLTVDIQLGATSIVLPGADAGQILATIEREKATKLFCPPTVWISLLRHEDFERRDLSSLRKAYYGASPMPVEILHELHRRLPGVRLFNFYGQTELAPIATILAPEDQVRKAGSAGRPAVNVETRVVDDAGATLPPGEVGEIVHRSPQATLGYWDQAGKTAESFAGGWFHSGDLGVFDEEGYLTVVDRKKDMIKTGGENVASREVEEVLYAHPDVTEAAVFATDHPVWIEAVTAAVVPRSGAALTTQSVIDFCRERLAPYKAPKYVAIVEDLPKNASGKILKRELRTRFAEIAAA
ncbi:Long-chain-fatty-acid--CoA ligase [Patulibacter medicamentivorans]|uniref:Long-chain-fatty-acid--CoA ligase n=1 Tax=Patulibacter medicamentivorans TaxID=1097667 RepID=H0E073_9ACTN|nr:Long-chain-fatty-acid--CoA ligase [Patulibacter medicamentivorans]